MKKIMIPLLVLMGVVISCFSYASCAEDQVEVKPYKDLQMSEIESIVVVSYKKEYILDAAEEEELLRILNEITIYGEYSSSTLFVGELEEHFSVRKNDGSAFVVVFSTRASK